MTILPRFSQLMQWLNAEIACCGSVEMVEYKGRTEMEKAPVAVTSRSLFTTRVRTVTIPKRSPRVKPQIVAHGVCLPLLSGSNPRRQERQSKHRAGNGDSLRPATWRPFFGCRHTRPVGTEASAQFLPVRKGLNAS